MKYHEIGERFRYNGVVLEVMRYSYCSHCYFDKNTPCGHSMDCDSYYRKDGETVCFKLVEQCKTKDMEQKTEIERIQEELIKIKQKEKRNMEQKETKKIYGMSDGDWSNCEEPTPPACMVKNEDGTYSFKEQSDEEIYGSLLDKLFTTYKAKNHDYQNAFSEMFDELGIDYAYGKLREKINRIKVLRKQPNMVENEGLEDALLDTAGYAILTLVELKKRKQ